MQAAQGQALEPFTFLPAGVAQRRARRGEVVAALSDRNGTGGDLLARLRTRRGEIELALFTRVCSISDPSAVSDPAYGDGLRASVEGAFGYVMEVLEHGEERAPPPPPVLLAQARLAARNAIGIDTVLRRYFAGYAVLSDFLATEASREGASSTLLAKLLARSTATFDCLLAAVGEEYAREAANRLRSTDQRRTERIERLLAGEPIDTTGFGYELAACHLALVATGSGATDALRTLANGSEARLLLARRDEGPIWAWLGTNRPLDSARVAALASGIHDVRLAIGEPAVDLAGWRFSHRQAAAALPLAVRGSVRVVRYRDVTLLASVLRDDLLRASLQRFYLAPLEVDRDGGEALRSTLRAYFASDRNVSSTAAGLRIDRKTVNRRLRVVEARLGQSLTASTVELEVALCLHETGTHATAQ